MIKSNLKDIDAIYAYKNGKLRELSQVLCRGKELWSSFKPFTVNFSYTGTIQTWTVPKSGLYLLSLKGSKGGQAGSSAVTEGGTTNKYVVLNKGEILYIVCGGYSTDNFFGGNRTSTGYNGGGSGYTSSNSYRVCSGGGATHIATKSGILSDLGPENLPYILAIAGGGGGSGYYSNNYGGKGGGLTGGASSVSGGGQTKTSLTSFGNGGNAISGCGSGGGLYGGASVNAGSSAPGAGGSGYIGTDTTTYKGIIYTNTTELGGNRTYGSASITRIA